MAGKIFRNGVAYGDGGSAIPDAVLQVKIGDKYYTPENGVVELPAVTQSGTLTLTVNGWSSNEQTVTYAHDTSKRNVIDVDPASIEEWASCGVLAISETATGITFKCSTVPENALSFKITSMGVN